MEQPTHTDDNIQTINNTTPTMQTIPTIPTTPTTPTISIKPTTSTTPTTPIKQTQSTENKLNENKTTKVEKHKIENLVFEGGGIKGLVFAGAMKYLQEKNITKNVKNIIGSSAGSIVATCLALGYTAKDLEFILRETDFSTFMDGNWGYMGDLYRFVNNYGIHYGDKLYNWIGSLIENKNYDSNLTLLELYNKTGINLVITGSNISKGKSTYFNYKTHANMPIKLAVRISASIPYIFAPIVYEGDMYVDGGLLDNYPIWYFKNYENTLGFKIVDKNIEKRDNTIYHNNNNINGIKDYTFCLLNSMLHQIERLHIKKGYWNRTVTIDSCGIDTLDFNIKNNKKDEMVNEGYDTTKKFLKTSEIYDY